MWMPSSPWANTEAGSDTLSFSHICRRMPSACFGQHSMPGRSSVPNHKGTLLHPVQAPKPPPPQAQTPTMPCTPKSFRANLLGKNEPTEVWALEWREAECAVRRHHMACLSFPGHYHPGRAGPTLFPFLKTSIFSINNLGPQLRGMWLLLSRRGRRGPRLHISTTYLDAHTCRWQKTAWPKKAGSCPGDGIYCVPGACLS